MSNLFPHLGIVRREPLSAIPHKNVNLLVTYVDREKEMEREMLEKINEPNCIENTTATVLVYGHFMHCEMAMNLTREAVDELVTHKQLYRQEIKRQAKKVRDEISRLNAWMYSIIHNEHLLDGYDALSDIYYDGMKRYNEGLYYSLRQACKPCVKDESLYSRLEAARIVCGLAVVCMEADIKKYYNYSFMRGIYSFNTKNLLTLLSQLEDMVKKRIVIKGAEDVNMNKDKNMCTAVKAFTNKMRDGNYLFKLLEKHF